MTTHSPQVISTVHAESVRVLRRDGDAWEFVAPAFQTRGVESAEVLAEIMGVDPVPKVPEAETLSLYRAMIEDGVADTTDALELRRRLVAHFGERHPAILDCDRLLRFVALANKTRKPAEG